MHYKIASIILNSEKKSSAISDIFIAQPDAHKENLAGKLFILAEIESQKSEAVKTMNFLLNNLNSNYYQNEKIILREKIESIPVENIFETTLAKTNKDLVEFLAREKINISPYALNLTICVLHKDELYVSSVGKNKNLLIYREKKEEKKKTKKIEEIKKIEYTMVDIGGEKERRSETVNLNKLFSEIISGKIPAGGSFLIINEALSEYISGKQFIKITTSLSPAGAAEQIKNILSQINAFVSFLGIIIKSSAPAVMDGENDKENKEIENEDYRPEIMMMEEKTEEILNPAGVINLKKKFRALAGKSSALKTERAKNAPRGMERILMLKEKVFFKKRDFFLSPKNILSLFSKIIKFVFNATILIFNILTNKSGTENPFKKNATIKSAGVENKETADRKAKLFLVVALILLIVFAVNIFAVHRKNNLKKEKENFEALITAIERNQNIIESDFLYNNENKIRETLQASKELFEKINEKELETNRVKELIEKQEGYAEKIKRITKILNPKEIANFSNLNSKASGENIVFRDKKIYSADAKEKAVYKIDLAENMVTALYDIAPTVEEFKFPAINLPNLPEEIYYLNKNNLALFDKKEKVTILPIEPTTEASDISAMAIYNSHLYLIDKKNGQIYKHNRLGDSFSAGEKWFGEAKNFSEAIGIFIDGNIYVFYENGSAEKYLKGERQDFSIEVLYDRIENASAFSVEKKNIYILEPKQKRLIIFDKEGKFIKQYLFPDLENIKDFCLDGQEKKAYLLNNTSVYEIDL